MKKEQKAKMKKALNHYITTDKRVGDRDAFISDMANSYLAYHELMMTYKIKQKEVDEEVGKIVDEIIERYGIE